MNTLDVDFRRSGDSRARMRRGGHRDGIKGDFGDGFVNAMFDTGVHVMGLLISVAFGWFVVA